MDAADLRSRAWATLAEQQRLFGRHVPGGRLLEGDGWVASVIPSAPDSPLLNTIVPLVPGATPGAVRRLDGEFGHARWGVWAERHDERALRAEGLRCDLAPWRLMAARIEELDDGPGEGEPTDDLLLVGAVNDVAYGLADGRLERHFGVLPADRVLGYTLERDGQAVAALGVLEHDGDAGFLFVATVPDARRRGLAGALMRRAIADARARGAASASLLATAMGRRLYRHLGFRDLGTARLWER